MRNWHYWLTLPGIFASGGFATAAAWAGHEGLSWLFILTGAALTVLARSAMDEKS